MKLLLQGQRGHHPLEHGRQQPPRQQPRKWSSLVCPDHFWSILANSTLNDTCESLPAQEERQCKHPCAPLALPYPPQIQQKHQEWNQKSDKSKTIKITENLEFEEQGVWKVHNWQQKMEPGKSLKPRQNTQHRSRKAYSLHLMEDVPQQPVVKFHGEPPLW